MRKNKGQVTVEAVLILAILVGILGLARNFLVEKYDLFSKMIATPWKNISGMAESGTWGRKDQVRSKHPNHFKNRMYTGPDD